MLSNVDNIALKVARKFSGNQPEAMVLAMAEMIGEGISEALSVAKTGLIKMAENGDLPMDLNDLNLTLVMQAGGEQ